MGGVMACLLMFPPLIVGIIWGACVQKEKDMIAMLRAEAKGRRDGWNERDSIESECETTIVWKVEQ